MSQITGRGPASSGAPGLGRTKPHVPELSTPNTTRARPSADSTVPTMSSRASLSAGVSAIRRAKRKNDQNDQHLTDEHPPP